MIHIPAGALHLRANPLVNWNYYAEAEEGTANRSLHWPRGKVLGGTSSINGMLYVRGNPADYDGWAQMGCRGWSYTDVLPHFKKSEHYVSGSSEYRGKGGPLLVEDYRTILPLTHRFVEAAQQVGFPFTSDYNGAQQEGVGYSQMTRRGRCRGAAARTVSGRSAAANLRVETQAVATRLLFGGIVAGVAFRQGAKRRCTSREVIVSGAPSTRRISTDLGDRSSRSSAVDRRRGGTRPAGCRRQPVRPFRSPRHHRVKDEVSINQLARGVRLAREVGSPPPAAAR
jgi:choline dehydrogenase